MTRDNTVAIRAVRVAARHANPGEAQLAKIDMQIILRALMYRRIIGRFLFAGLSFVIYDNKLIAFSETQCQTRIAPIVHANIRSGADLALVSDYEDLCKVEKIEFADPDCHATVSFEHGSTSFICGKKGFNKDPWSERWQWTTGQFYGDALSFIGPTRAISIPKHTRARRAWLAPIDEEGFLYADYPIKMDIVRDYYPETILASDTRKPKLSAFPIRSQIVTFRNMRGDVRSAIAGRVTFGCSADLSVYRWSDPKLATALQDELEKNLLTVKLTPITDHNQEWIERACKRPPLSKNKQ